MRVETVTRKLYHFDELSDDAKENARDWWRQCPGAWGWANEWWQSAQEFSKIAPVDIIEADYDRSSVRVSWTGDNDVAELSGVRAWKWLQNNGWFDLAARNAKGECTLTGYCGDCDLFDPLDEYAKVPGSVPELRQVFYECAQSWVEAARDDLEYSYSDECVDEFLTINEYEFTETGKIA